MNKQKHHIIPLILLLVVLVVSCTSTKNTSTTRWYHSFNTRFNVYFNGKEAFNEAYKNQINNYQESYSDLIYMYPVSSLDKEKPPLGGPYQKSMEKAIKAIKTHSIKAKPKKEAGKRSDPKYQEFMKRDEYNPFLYKAWMLLAESQFYNGDFLTSSSTFSYVAKHYAVQPEISVPAKIWQARAYQEMGWLYEADDILSKIKTNTHLSKADNEWFSSIYADYLIKNKQYKESVPYLITAIDAEKNGTQKSRMKYLLGQIYTMLDQKELAYKAFGEVSKAHPPYKLDFNAKIRQSEVYPGGNINKVTGDLKKMAKSSKNKDYLDQVYYALGNVYMSVPDTVKAIESYKLGAEKSTQNQLDKALCQIKLGDIYFQQREYIKAQPCYSEALGQLKKENKEYAKVSKRSAVLDELVVHAEAVHLQDSLQVLARMPESERLAVVNKIIDGVKKKEEEDKKKAERAEMEARQELMRDNSRSPMGAPQPTIVNTALASADKNSFYFYNEQSVATGKSAFQQKWGRRILEDNWRRKSKISQQDDDMNADQGTDNTLAAAGTDQQTPKTEGGDLSEAAGKDTTSKGPSDDLKDPKFYLQQIPSTEEEMEASNLIIADGLYNMGVIFKDKLVDYDLAIETFMKLETRFPVNDHEMDEYYHMYLMYLKMENMPMAQLYKSKIRDKFPESELAIAMADPDYENNIRTMVAVQDSMYENTYEAYLKSDVSTIRKNYETAQTKYAQSKLIPKFMFLNALSYVQTNEPDTFKVRLKELVEKYPQADVSVLAEEIMKRFQKGMSLSGDGNLVRGGLFNFRFGAEGDSTVIDTAIVFSAEKRTPYQLMLVFPTGTADKNIMLYNVAEFNFSNFMVNDFDLEFESAGDISMLQIKGFNNYEEITQYCKMIQRPEGFANKLEPSVIVVPISTENLGILMKGKSLEEYTAFFAENFGADYPQLIQKWKLKQEEKSVEELSDDEEVDKLLDAGTEKVPTTNTENAATEKQETKDIDSTKETKVTEPEKKTDSSVTDSINKQKEPVSIEKKEPESKAITSEEVVDKVNEKAESVNETVNDVNSTLDEISKDPIRGIKGLFSKDKKSNAIDEYVKQQEKEEKDKQKELKKEQAEKAKADKVLLDQQNKEKAAALKKQQEEEKALLKEKQQHEDDLKKLKEQEEKQKVQESNRIKNERAAANKKKEEDRKAKEKQRKEDRNAKEKAAKEKKKLKEEQRKADLKKKEEAAKEKKKQRETGIKQPAAEKKQPEAEKKQETEEAK